MDKQNQPSKAGKKPFTLIQKIVVGFLFTLSFVVLIFGFKNFNNQIAKPFKIEQQPEEDNQNSESTEIIEQQNKDTDNDGLNDYEETYIYQTSPYLSDSDSDGIDDKKEIDLGKNPNCPEGQNCGSSNISGETPSQNSIDDANLFTTDTGDATQNPTPGNNSIPPASLTATEIREILKQSDIPPEMLDQISDEDIITLYKKTLASFENQ